jgi:hypothetical protein
MEMLNYFCHGIRTEIEATHPVRMVVDVSHSEVIWAISTARHPAFEKLLRRICQQFLDFNNRLSTEGFEKMSIGFGIASGLVIIGPHEAFGTTRTKAFACGKLALEKQAIVISEEAAKQIDTAWCVGAFSIRFPTSGIRGGSQEALVVDLRKFLGER